jgi:hypothetical protein
VIAKSGDHRAGSGAKDPSSTEAPSNTTGAGTGLRAGISEIEACTPLSFITTVLDSNTTTCSRLFILPDETDLESDDTELWGVAIGARFCS